MCTSQCIILEDKRNHTIQTTAIDVFREIESLHNYISVKFVLLFETFLTVIIKMYSD